MKKKFLINASLLFLSFGVGFAQDTSNLLKDNSLKNKSPIFNLPIDRDTMVFPSGKAHSSVNSNRGTSVSGTTSGTLNSNVNPSTELVIPIREKKAKLKSKVTYDSTRNE